MINLNYNLSEIKNNINLITKEISSGNKNLNSNELNQSFSLKTDMNNLKFINSKIEEFKIKTDSADIAISSLKNNISSIKASLIKLNDSSFENNKNEIKTEIESNLKDIKNILNTEINGKKVFNNNNEKVLVSFGKYKNFDVSLNNILNGNNTDLIGTIENITNNINDKQLISDSLSKIDNIYDNINLNQSKIGIFNNSLNEITSTNNKQITNLKEKKSNLEDTDYTEAFIKLNQLNLQYNAYAMTITKVQELSLVNFIK